MQQKNDEKLSAQEVLADIKAAVEMVYALCQPAGTSGAKEWLMSIPARPESDPDIVIAKALGNAKLFIEGLSAERRISQLVDRFLSWPLPESVCSDLCTTIPGRSRRTGTNLLTAIEAKQMLDHVLEGFAESKYDKEYVEALEKMSQGMAEVLESFVNHEHNGVSFEESKGMAMGALDSYCSFMRNFDND